MDTEFASGWTELFDNESDNVKEIIQTIESRKELMRSLPEPGNVFRMFRIMPLHKIKVVLMGQDPYPTSCPITSIPYACGIAFVPAEGTKKKPKTLLEMEIELQRDLSTPQAINQHMLFHWISQGVFMTNMGLTVGTQCEDYLVNHKILWEKFSRAFLRYISTKGRTVFCFMGTEAWRMTEEIDTSTNAIIKVYHPASRSSDKSFVRSSAYSKINQALAKLGQPEIQWYKP